MREAKEYIEKAKRRSKTKYFRYAYLTSTPVAVVCAEGIAIIIDISMKAAFCNNQSETYTQFIVVEGNPYETF